MFDFGVLIRGLNAVGLVYATCSKLQSQGQAALSFIADVRMTALQRADPDRVN